MPDEKKRGCARIRPSSVYDADGAAAERGHSEFLRSRWRAAALLFFFFVRSQAAANWVIKELAGRLNKEGGHRASRCGLAARVAPTILIRSRGRFGRSQGRLRRRLGEGGDPRELVRTRGRRTQVNRHSPEIARWGDEIIARKTRQWFAQAKAKAGEVGGSWVS